MRAVVSSIVTPVVTSVVSRSDAGPTLVSQTVLADGVTLRLVFSQPLIYGSAVGLTGSVVSIVSAAVVAGSLDVVISKINDGAIAGTISYSGAGILAGASGAVAAFGPVAIDNQSTQLINPNTMAGTLDLWRWHDLTRLWTTSALSTPVASVGDPVGGWRGQLDAYTLIQAVANSRYEYAADGILVNSASNTKSMEAAYAQAATDPFWIARRVIGVSNSSPRVGMGTSAADTIPNSATHDPATGEQRAVVRFWAEDSPTIGTGDKCMVVWYDGTLAWMMDDSGAVISCPVGTNATAIAALRVRATLANNVNARIKYFQIGTTGMTASLAAQWMTWARAQP